LRVSPACVHKLRITLPSPHDHFSAGPNCGVVDSRSGRVNVADCDPGIGGGFISFAQQKAPTPDNHFSARPDRRVTFAARWSIYQARCDPTVGDGIVSTAGTAVPGNAAAATAPDNHFGSGPNC